MRSLVATGALAATLAFALGGAAGTVGCGGEVLPGEDEPIAPGSNDAVDAGGGDTLVGTANTPFPGECTEAALASRGNACSDHHIVAPTAPSAPTAPVVDASAPTVSSDAGASPVSFVDAAAPSAPPVAIAPWVDTPPVDAGTPAEPADASSDASVDAGTVAYPTLDSYVGGVNLSGGEFAPSQLPGTYGYNYEYPTTSEVDAFVADGFRLFRIPFLWERLQPTLGQPLDATEVARVEAIARYATAQGAYVVLDPQDSARYDGVVIGDDRGTTAPTAGDFGTFWSLLATRFADDPRVVFGLMNEPSQMSTELWLADANTAIASIRQAGATNLIFVPGNGWTGAWSWSLTGDYGTPNSDVMLGVNDPLDNWMYEVHQYLDADSSGASAVCSGDTGAERLAGITQWLTANHKRAFLAEVAVSTDPSCDGILDPMLSFMDQHRDVWAGWAWWGAGPMWGSYKYSIEPGTGVDVQQIPILQKHL